MNNLYRVFMLASMFAGLGMDEMMESACIEEEIRDLDAKWKQSTAYPRKKKKRVRKELLKRYAELNVSEKEVRRRFKQ